MSSGNVGIADLRLAGMIVGVLVSFASVVVSAVILGARGVLGPFGAGLAGAPIGGLLGWWLGPRLATGSWREAIGLGLRAGVLAAPLGALEYLYVFALASLASGPGRTVEAAGEAVFGGIYLLVFCWVVVPITVPCGIAAAAIVRGLPRQGATGAAQSSPIGLRHVLTVLVLVAIGAALVPLGAGEGS